MARQDGIGPLDLIAQRDKGNKVVGEPFQEYERVYLVKGGPIEQLVIDRLAVLQSGILERWVVVVIAYLIVVPGSDVEGLPLRANLKRIETGLSHRLINGPEPQE
jgi:hypothetical protein